MIKLVNDVVQYLAVTAFLGSRNVEASRISLVADVPSHA